MYLEDRGLYHVAMAFKERIKVSRSLHKMRQHIYDQAQHLDLVSTLTFIDMVLKRLPKYRDLFETVGNAYDLDWQWLAAMAYQESHWNPEAVSPTGVQGLMMLTKVTARELGVADRVDPTQSVDGGARYLMGLKQRLSSDIKGPDRFWMALASYNVGLGHLQDARMLARQFGANANLWREVKKYLPLLTKPKWYQQTRFGYARGHEPVKYVENIRSYYEILKWLTSREAKLILVKNEITDTPRNTL
jgi:membrane-bound lytic murein transglycosylase F